MFIIFYALGETFDFKWNEDELNLLDDDKGKFFATVLLKTILTVLGGSLHKSLSLTDDYFCVGGNSLNAVIVVTKLKDQGFSLGIWLFNFCSHAYIFIAI